MLSIKGFIWARGKDVIQTWSNLFIDPLRKEFIKKEIWTNHSHPLRSQIMNHQPFPALFGLTNSETCFVYDIILKYFVINTLKETNISHQPGSFLPRCKIFHIL